MAHSHSHADSHLPKDNNARRLLFAFIVTAGFMLLEVVGGILSGSLALLADAGHMLTDAAALLFALLAVQFSRRPPTVRHTFGWLRLTTGGGLCECHCVGGHYPSHCLGSDRALLHATSGGGQSDDGDCGRGSAGEPVCVLDTPSGKR